MKKINVFIIAILFLLPNLSKAMVPFGGPIIGVYECGCTGGLLVVVYDYFTKLPVPMLYEPFISRLNMNFNIVTPLVMTVGSWVPGAVCSMGSLACTPVPVAGWISPYPMSGVGTGLIPAVVPN